ncbi:type II toxin-antitoxin system Xre/ParS family antitoxin [Collimonas sp.]|jgi:putative toxin-antitoxin system antitoxin component (TIGR02293 family)|uniref:type II RES/Xre toxin-antitoxin system antitoxin n=1 Tax=Collimonas sp. TaxID=1963772 RepID=UPI002CC2CF5C|nr:antitoxin Xre/MbcA/ParS toxin-binding domain-containing protein [Collimonas sp.]HWW08487.1 antitoxin Xre/MbcA/ParS toxin-binding domain-containing protein [Collimonas sp.]
MSVGKSAIEKHGISKKRRSSVVKASQEDSRVAQSSAAEYVVIQRVSKPHGADIFKQIVSGKPMAGFAAVKVIREGYPAQVLKAASSFLGVSDARIQTIAQVPATTASRLEKNQSKIDSAATERVYRMGTVTRMAIEVFADKDSAIEWMRRPNRALGDAAPLDLMDTEPGAVAVRQVLNAIETGGVA